MNNEPVLNERLNTLAEKIKSRDPIMISGVELQPKTVSEEMCEVGLVYYTDTLADFDHTLRALHEKTDIEVLSLEYARRDPNVIETAFNRLRTEDERTTVEITFWYDYHDEATPLTMDGETATELYESMSDVSIGTIEPEYISDEIRDGLTSLIPRANDTTNDTEHNEEIPIGHAAEIADKYHDGSDEYGQGWLAHNDFEDEEET
jgi:hypothetical protein